MGREYGILSRMTLNYDFAFLAMLGLSVKETCAGFERKRCLFNPLKKCLCCKGGEAFSFSAAASMVMLYYKLKDNVADQTFLKSIPARLALPYAAHMRKKARKRYEPLDGVMEEYIEAQGRVEAENTQSVDAAAVPTARMLSKVCAMLSGDEREKRVLSRLGYCLGRWIYLIDAAKGPGKRKLQCVPAKKRDYQGKRNRRSKKVRRTSARTHGSGGGCHLRLVGGEALWADFGEYFL